MITIFALEGCKKCKQLIELLNKELIEHKVYHEDNNEKLYDRIEQIVDCYTYPIIELSYRYNRLYITDNSSTSKEKYILKYNDIEHAFKLIKENI